MILIKGGKGRRRGVVIPQSCLVTKATISLFEVLSNNGPSYACRGLTIPALASPLVIIRLPIVLRVYLWNKWTALRTTGTMMRAKIYTSVISSSWLGCRRRAGCNNGWRGFQIMTGSWNDSWRRGRSIVVTLMFRTCGRSWPWRIRRLWLSVFLCAWRSSRNRYVVAVLALTRLCSNLLWSLSWLMLGARSTF